MISGSSFRPVLGSRRRNLSSSASRNASSGGRSGRRARTILAASSSWSANRCRTRSSFVGKYANRVRRETSASRAISVIETWSNPDSRNMRIAVAAIVSRRRAFLRSRNPAGSVMRPSIPHQVDLVYICIESTLGGVMQTEVIVVGAGPAGLMLASELTLAGIPAVVMEKQPTRSTQSRAGALQPRTAEVLDLRGLLDPLLDRALPRGEFGGHFAGLPVELDCRPWQTRHPYPVAIPQARLEAFLEQRLVGQGVPVLRGHEVTAVEQDADGVTAAGVRGSYLVACDGGHSTIRKLLGVPFPGTAGKMSGVVADITLASRSAAVSTTSEHFSQYIKTTAGFFRILYPVERDLYRLMFGRLSGAGPARNEPVTASEVGEVLRTVYGSETELGELREASRFSDASRQVESYREGRVFFAGDAAHIHLP